MALLDLMQNVANELGLPAITAVVNSSDNQVQQLYALLVRDGKEVRSSQEWPELTKEGTITLVAGQDSYAFPEDMDRQVFQSQWDRSQRLELVGPVSPQEWQAYKSGIVTPTTRTMFRVKGFRSKRFYIHPTPAAADAGKVLYFEYQTLTWCLPKAWTVGATFSANTYCSYDGNIYTTTEGGTTGATPPTHTSSSASDGSVSWTYSSAAYEKPLADTDTFVLDQVLHELGVKWRFMEANRFQYAEYKQQAEEAARIQISTTKSAPVLYLHRRRGLSRFLSDEDIPDGSYG